MGMFSRRLASRKGEQFQEPSINVTPLIDVVFVLLISFIIIAPLLEKEGVQLAPSGVVAQESQLKFQDQSLITIHVLADNTILVCGKRVAPVLLAKTLGDLKKRYPKERPQVFHDKRAMFGTYQLVKNALEASGFLEMDIVLDPAS